MDYMFQRKLFQQDNLSSTQKEKQMSKGTLLLQGKYQLDNEYNL